MSEIISILITTHKMIEDIIITDLRDAESYAYSPTKRTYNIWISTVDEEHRSKAKRIENLLAKKNIKHFCQFFYDWSEEDNPIFKHLEKDAPTMKHIERIISFLLLPLVLLVSALVLVASTFLCW